MVGTFEICRRKDQESKLPAAHDGRSTTMSDNEAYLRDQRANISPLFGQSKR
jgi:hypothetical protein